MVRALVAEPVPTVMPLPPQPPVLVVLTLVILLLVMVEETNPVSTEIPTGVAPAEVVTLIVLALIKLFNPFPTSIPILAIVVFVLMVLPVIVRLSRPVALTEALPTA